MSSKILKSSLLFGAAGAALSLAITAPAMAQSQTVATSQADLEPTDANHVVVLGEIAYRNRTDETAPVLEYGLDYFQRFEPLSVGDALKRVPSVSFLSDVLESDGVRLRGLDPAYTQILINGEKVAGSGADSGAFGNGADGAFFVDRIPAELIERVEIVRSQSANRSGDAMAGALNIVLRDGYSLEGGYVRAGALGFNDGRIRETYGAVWGGEMGGGRLLLGANVQGRRNPKEKTSLRYTAPGGTLTSLEDQIDLRDGTDYSGNFSYQRDVGPGEFSIDGFYVKTDRYADEHSVEYINATQTFANINSINDNDVDTAQSSWSLNADYTLDLFGGETRFKLGYASFETDEPEFEDEIEYRRDALPYGEADRFTHDLVAHQVDDTEMKAKIEHDVELGFGELEIGLHYDKKERDNFDGEGEFRQNIPNGSPPVPDASGAGLPFTVTQPAIDAVPGGDNTIERTQIAPYAMISGTADAIAWEAGVRYESTETSIEDRTGPSTTSHDTGIFLPSAHVRWDVTTEDRINASVARTLRNPSFDFLSPSVLEEELADNDFQGNPDLDPETAWGVDLGYERRIGKSGVAGVNLFYRAVSDVIEVYSTGARGSACDPLPAACDASVYSARNTGDGSVWGIEFDYSAPLEFVGLPDTGVFLNYSWLDSDIEDEFGSRRFNSQSDYIFNVGFIQDLRDWGAAFGVTYRKQGDAFSRVVGEEVTTSYEGVLEAFVEKSFGENFTLRLTGSNLLDGSKDEAFNKFASLDDQMTRSFDEYELETETAGPAWQLIGRMSF